MRHAALRAQCARLLGPAALAIGLHCSATAADPSKVPQATSKPILKVLVGDKIVYTDRVIGAAVHGQVQTLGGRTISKASPVGAPGTNVTNESAPKAVQPGPTAAAPAGPEAQLAQMKAGIEQRDRAIKEQTAELERQNAAVAKGNCSAARSNLAMLSAGRASRIDNTGTRVFYTDEELRQETSAQQALADTYCR